VIAIAVGVAYAGGAFSIHGKSPGSAASPSSTHPSPSASGGADVAGISATHAPKATPKPTPVGGDSVAAETPQALCEAWLKDPWRPGVKNWDDEDFDKLSTLAGGPQMVLFYCWKNLPRGFWGSWPFFRFPPRYSNGHWDWTPGNQPPASGDGNSQGGANSQGNNNAQGGPGASNANSQGGPSPPAKANGNSANGNSGSGGPAQSKKHN
jgi:hypothetical protein